AWASSGSWSPDAATVNPAPEPAIGMIRPAGAALAGPREQAAAARIRPARSDALALARFALDPPPIACFLLAVNEGGWRRSDGNRPPRENPACHANSALREPPLPCCSCLRLGPSWAARRSPRRSFHSADPRWCPPAPPS